MTQIFTDDAFTTLQSGIISTDLTIPLKTGDGGKFPSPSSPDFFVLTLADPNNPETKWERVKITARSGDSLTVPASGRGWDGTTAQSWSGGDRAEIRLGHYELTRLVGREVPLITEPSAAPGGTNDDYYPAQVGYPGLFRWGAGENRPHRFMADFADEATAFLVYRDGNNDPFSVGFSPSTSQGTRTSYTPVSTDYVSSQGAQVWTTAASVNVAAGMRDLQLGRYWRGNAAGLGGFRYHIRFVLVTLASDQIAFFGLSGGSNFDLGATNPSGIAGDHVFLGADDTDANLQLMTRDNTTTNKVDTGIVKSTANTLVDLWLYCPPNGNIVATVDKVIGSTRTRAITNQTLSTNAPRNDQFMRPQWQIGTKGDAAAAAFRLCSLTAVALR